MPIYEYECTKCGTIEEAIQKFSDDPLKSCKHCSGRLQKLVSHTSFHLKGTGWYVTDYAGKSRSSPSSDTTNTKTDTTATTGNTDTDTKPAKKNTDK